MADKAVNFIKDVHSHTPPCVLFSVINTCFNGWVTSVRFQDAQRCCYISVDCDGTDSLEHYACCPLQWSVLANRFRKSITLLNLRRFLGLDVVEIDDKVFLACHMYAVKRMVEMRRHLPHDAIDNQFDALLWQRHRTASLYHAGLRRRHSNIYSHDDFARFSVVLHTYTHAPRTTARQPIASLFRFQCAICLFRLRLFSFCPRHVSRDDALGLSRIAARYVCCISVLPSL